MIKYADSVNLRGKGLLLLMVPEGCNPSWRGRCGSRQGRHGGRSRRPVGHVVPTLRKPQSSAPVTHVLLQGSASQRFPNSQTAPPAGDQAFTLVLWGAFHISPPEVTEPMSEVVHMGLYSHDKEGLICLEHYQLGLSCSLQQNTHLMPFTVSRRKERNHTPRTNGHITDRGARAGMPGQFTGNMKEEV